MRSMSSNRSHQMTQCFKKQKQKQGTFHHGRPSPDFFCVNQNFPAHSSRVHYFQQEACQKLWLRSWRSEESWQKSQESTVSGANDYFPIINRDGSWHVE